MSKTKFAATNPQILHKSKPLENYTFGETLGRGAFGKVKLGTHKLTSEKVAIKILEKAKLVEADDIQRVNREIDLLKRCRHQHVIRVYEVLETPSEFFIIMEYVSGGELSDYILAKRFLKEDEACRLFKQIVDAIDYLGKNGIAHRDLKPENILLDENRNVKIIDFGLSNTYKTGELLKTACGSPCYAAPEMIAGKEYIGNGADIWSCGIILYAMLCGRLPFEDRNANSLYKKILEDDFVVPRHISLIAKDLLRRILVKDPAKRYKTVEILGHSWCNSTEAKSLESEPKAAAPSAPINHTVLQSLDNYGLDTVEAQKSLHEEKHDHLTATYYLLQQKFLRNEGTGSRNKICKETVPSVPVNQSDEESPYSNDKKGSLSKQLINGLAYDRPNKKVEYLQVTDVKARSSVESDEIKGISSVNTEKLDSPINAEQQPLRLEERYISSRKGSSDNQQHRRDDVNNILKPQNKKLRIKTSFLTQLKEARANINVSTSRHDINVNCEEAPRPKTDRERVELTSSMAKDLEINYKSPLEIKSPINKTLKSGNLGVDTKYEMLSTAYCFTDEKEAGIEDLINCEKPIDNENKQVRGLSVETGSLKSISIDSNPDLDNGPYGLSKAKAQKSYLTAGLPNNNKDLYSSIRNTLKSTVVTQNSQGQGLISPKNNKFEMNSSSLMNSKVNSTESRATNVSRQNGASLDAIKKLIKNSFGPKHHLKEDYLESSAIDKTNGDFAKACMDLNIQTENKGVDQASASTIKQPNQTPKAHHAISFLRSRESPQRNYSRDLLSELGDSVISTNVTKKMGNPMNVDMLLMKDIKRRKSTQKGGILETVSQAKYKTTLWPAAPVPCEEEQTRLYNKFKKHLINIQ